VTLAISERLRRQRTSACGSLWGILGMVACCRTEVALFGQPGRTKGHAEKTGGLFVIASDAGVGVCQFGAHGRIVPISLFRPLASMGLFSRSASAFA
jgi:hypothetical protein